MTQKQQNIPKLLLTLPIVAWALTFTYGTALLFNLMNIAGNHCSNAFFINSLITSICLNAIVMLFMFLASFYYADYQKELLRRIALMLVNIPVAVVYFMILCQFGGHF